MRTTWNTAETIRRRFLTASPKERVQIREFVTAASCNAFLKDRTVFWLSECRNFDSGKLMLVASCGTKGEYPGCEAEAMRECIGLPPLTQADQDAYDVRVFGRKKTNLAEYERMKSLAERSAPASPGERSKAKVPKPIARVLPTEVQTSGVKRKAPQPLGKAPVSAPKPLPPPMKSAPKPLSKPKPIAPPIVKRTR